jgi:hypothetical protein
MSPSSDPFETLAGLSPPHRQQRDADAADIDLTHTQRGFNRRARRSRRDLLHFVRGENKYKVLEAGHEVEVLVGCVFVAVVKPKLRVQTVVIGPDFDAQIAVGAGSAKPVQPAIAQQPFLLLVRIAGIACPSAYPIAATTVAPVINALEIAAHVLLEKLPDLRPGHVATAVTVVQGLERFDRNQRLSIGRCFLGPGSCRCCRCREFLRPSTYPWVPRRPDSRCRPIRPCLCLRSGVN